MVLQGDPVLLRSTACWPQPLLVWPPIRSADSGRSQGFPTSETLGLAALNAEHPAEEEMTPKFRATIW